MFCGWGDWLQAIQLIAIFCLEALGENSLHRTRLDRRKALAVESIRLELAHPLPAELFVVLDYDPGDVRCAKATFKLALERRVRQYVLPPRLVPDGIRVCACCWLSAWI